MSDEPLRGARVVVTRAAAQATALVERLEQAGADVLTLALIEIVEPADGGAALSAALADVSRYDWVVVTSPNGATRVSGALAGAPPGRPRVAAVGAATAAALGRPVDLVPARQIAEGLLDAMPAGPGRVLLAQAEGARAVLADGLRDRGYTVDAVAAYRTRPVDPGAAAAGRALAADAVLFMSGSAARAWARSLGTATPPVVVALGPATAAVATEVGLKVSAVAADHSVAGLVAALLGALRSAR
ncbi:MAG: uroporphyrinogen-III synthase [Actinomycetota bacterium]|nr:MAG: uroporphyrinogen-III synthase [Actinomycetota bacterium]